MADIYGSQGDDVLTGTAFDDDIEDIWGDDIIDGGDGNDTIVDLGGSNVIHGGLGNDYISLTAADWGGTVYEGIVRANLIDAGDGADVVDVYCYGQQSLDIDLGAGADLLTFDIISAEVLTQITTGAGSDRIVLGISAGESLRYTDGAPAVVTDFTAGDGGDVLDLAAALSRLLAAQPHSQNPFADGHLLLVQDGADVIVRVDIDGTAGGGSGGWYDRDLFRLSNVSVADLTAYNFGGLDPDGLAPAYSSVTGTDNPEWLSADAVGSDLRGLGGDDRLRGGIGNDLLNGGAGNDTIDGGLGNDLLRGGDGDDVISDPSGADIIDGGAGNDTIDIEREAGAGDFGPISISGGIGDDYVRFVSPDGATLNVDLGSGSDTFEIPKYLESVTLTLGAGHDHVRFGQTYFLGASNPVGVVITDFAAGNSGDVLDLDSLMLASASGWDGVSNPFAAGYLVVEQSGADTIVSVDWDGTGANTNHLAIAVLQNVDSTALTAFNFGGFAPNGAPSRYRIAVGTAGDDHLQGSYDSDTINGGDGNDLIEEHKAGSDTLIGGAGDDTIILTRYDAFFPGIEHVTIDAGTGRDTVDIGWSTGQVTVNLGADDDRLIIDGLPDLTTSVTLGSGSDIIEFSPGSASTGTWPLVVTDFQTGAGGDRLDWAQFAEQEEMNGEPDYNPFHEGDARLVQVGADVQLQLALVGGNHQALPSYFTVMTFQNTNVADFTAENIGYNPYVPTIVGGSGDDGLSGTSANDVIDGYEGNDTLSGLAGDDLIWGDGGADTLSGGIGNDQIRGGADSDIVNGDAGADNLDGGFGVDTVDGGDGDDTIYDWQGVDALTGGAGNDSFHIYLAFDEANGTGWGSLDAGDGNDVVDIQNIYIQTGYALNLGAGDDIVRFIHPSGQVTLGAGHDTIEWADSYNIDGTLVVTDFQAGDGGDVFDLNTFLQEPLERYSDPEFPDGFNPFAAGYVELRQVGTEVRMYFHREGYNETQYSPVIAVRFLNTDLSQFTGANFGGYDPHATHNWTTVLSVDTTLAAGHSHVTTNVTGISGYGFTVSPGYMFGFGVSATLTNHGTITSTVDSLYPAGSATGIFSGPAPSAVAFVNASDGHVTVNGAWFDDLYGPDTGANTYGLFGNIAFANNGSFDVTAASGTAFGQYGDGSFANSGTFTVTSAWDAYGIASFNDVDFVNTGSIVVHGADYAVGVFMGDITNAGFSNAGTITATTDGSSLYGSIGVYLGGRADSTYHHSNSGTITADIAIYADAWIRTGPGAYNIADYLDNSGTINGVVMLAAGNDVVTNSGTMSGRTLLEDGNDRYDGSAGVHLGTVEGGTGNDTLLGGAGNETFYGDDDDDVLGGGGGNDFLDGGSGNDLINGGSGIDTASYAGAASRVVVNLGTIGAQDTRGAGTDTISGVENLAGSAFADALTGNSGANMLTGNGGNDVLDGGAGADLMQGGAGDDIYYVDNAADGVVEKAGEGLDLVSSSVSFTLGSNIENLTLTGTAANGTGNALANRIVGNASANVIDGGAGADVMRGGLGNDIYYVDNARDNAIENAGEGTDSVVSSVSFTLASNIENLTITGTAVRGNGNSLANSIGGNSANNILNGGAGADVMAGGLGDDSYYVDNAADAVLENSGEGRDRVYSSVTYTLGANADDLFLRGSAAINATGNALDNTLRGNSAANVLTGGAGADDLRGGTGSDTFVFHDGDFAGLTPSTSDRIIDFSHAEGDHIDLAGVDANSTTGTDETFAFIGNAAFSHTAGELRYEITNGNTYLTGDTNGDGLADFMVRLDGSHALVSGDFAL